MPLIVVGARVLIEDEQGALLVMRRADDGLWGLPGGSTELGESPLDTALREAREETGSVLSSALPFALPCDPAIERHTYPDGDRVQNVSSLTHTSAPSVVPRAADGEATAFRFVHPHEIDPVEFSRPGYPSFAHWEAYRRTRIFRVV